MKQSIQSDHSQLNLLLVGDANSIFLYQFVKALKPKMKIHVTVYSPMCEMSSSAYKDLPYDEVYFDNFRKSPIGRLRFWGSRLQPFVNRYKFHRFLKCNKKYDIIDFHWILPAWVLFSKSYKRFGNKIGGRLWGGELDKLTLCGSRKLYLHLLKSFIGNLDFYTGIESQTNIYSDIFSLFKGLSYYGTYGSSIIEAMNGLSLSRQEAKQHYNIQDDKITVLLGYSGKKLHRHFLILKCIISDDRFGSIRDKLHFLAPMTRGADAQYINSLEKELEQSGCTYTIIKDIYMTDKDVALLRLSTDIAFQLSEFDRLSSSIEEILTSGSILICGNWFPLYFVFKEKGFNYYEVDSIDSGIEKMYEIVTNIQQHFQHFRNNMDVGKSKSSWNDCINVFVTAYNTVLEK